MTAFYSILHFLVDGVCAAAMFGYVISGKDGYVLILLYNFCAFALQMPFGAVLDAVNEKEEERMQEELLRNADSKQNKKDWSLTAAFAGVLCTIVGAVTHPVLLGIGNALFHVGGGVGTICQKSRERGYGGNGGNDGDSGNCADWTLSGSRSLLVRLGVFVAPGALGLYLGTLAAKAGYWSAAFLCGSAAMLLCCAVFFVWLRRTEELDREQRQDVRTEYLHRTDGIQKPGPVAESVTDIAGSRKSGGSTVKKYRIVRLSVCCLLVVIIRSYIGMAVTFPWKTGISAGLPAVLALAGGKTAGGFLAAWGGAKRTAAVSLMSASVCYLFSFVMPIGLAALFFFNMTMPITLYWMIAALPRMPGFVFGFLTFALFLGFLPAYLNMQSGLTGNVIGSAGSFLSLLLLAAGIGMDRHGGRERLSVL